MRPLPPVRLTAVFKTQTSAGFFDDFRPGLMGCIIDVGAEFDAAAIGFEGEAGAGEDDVKGV